jgi:hypothetical protein
VAVPGDCGLWCPSPRIVMNLLGGKELKGGDHRQNEEATTKEMPESCD